MKNLSKTELININGGCDSCPQVMKYDLLQDAYEIGYHIGKAIGETVDQVGDFVKALSPFSWFKQ